MKNKSRSDSYTLEDLRPGQLARVSSVSAHNPGLSARLLCMGLVAGTAIEVVCIAPLGGAIQVKTRGYDLSLRCSEARQVQVEIN